MGRWLYVHAPSPQALPGLKLTHSERAGSPARPCHALRCRHIATASPQPATPAACPPPAARRPQIARNEEPRPKKLSFVSVSVKELLTLDTREQLKVGSVRTPAAAEVPQEGFCRAAFTAEKDFVQPQASQLPASAPRAARLSATRREPPRRAHPNGLPDATALRASQSANHSCCRSPLPASRSLSARRTRWGRPNQHRARRPT